MNLIDVMLNYLEVKPPSNLINVTEAVDIFNESDTSFRLFSLRYKKLCDYANKEIRRAANKGDTYVYVKTPMGQMRRVLAEDLAEQGFDVAVTYDQVKNFMGLVYGD